MIVIGADLGQAQDPTALTVAEVHPPDIHVRHLERLPLGTPESTQNGHWISLMRTSASGSQS
jgi:hypothetical protein